MAWPPLLTSEMSRLVLTNDLAAQRARGWALWAPPALGSSMVGLLSDHGYTPACQPSGHFICSWERTDHILPTHARDAP